MKLSVITLSLAAPLVAQAADYRPGWDAGRFYSEVVSCEAAIVFPEIQGYQKRGIAKGRTEESLRGEMIANEPVFEHLAAQVCQCAVNEVAKYTTYEAYNADKTVLKNAFSSQACNAQAVMQGTTKEQAEALRLK